MSDIRIEVDGADQLATAFAEAPEHMQTSLVPTLDEQADKLQRDWRGNARKTARRHGRRYPSSITHDLTVQDGAISADVGPERMKPQGEMGPGFEYGSVNQPPHYDGARAFSTNAPKFVAAIEADVDRIIREALL